MKSSLPLGKLLNGLYYTMDNTSSPNFELPGFRFHPTEEELLDFYLKNMVNGRKMHHDIIGYLNIYRFDPSDLPGLSNAFYFFPIYSIFFNLCIRCKGLEFKL